MAKQTRITIETNSVLVLKGRSSTRGWCSRCGCEQELITVETTGANSMDEVLSPSSLHLLEGNGGALVCLKSLLASVKLPKIW